MPLLEIQVYEGTQCLWTGLAEPPVEIGRHEDDHSEAVVLLDLGNHRRLNIAPLRDRSLPRHAVKIEASVPGSISVRNVHTQIPFTIGPPDATINPGEVVDLKSVVAISLPGNRTVSASIWGSEIDSNGDKPLSESFYRSVKFSEQTYTRTVAIEDLNELLDDRNNKPHGRTAVALVRAALNVIHQAAGSDEFFNSAAKTAAEMIHLDRACVVLHRDDQWHLRSTYSAHEESGASTETFSRGLVDHVRRTGETLIFDPQSFPQEIGQSMVALDRAVAAPIRDQAGCVIGVLYGERRTGFCNAGTPIGELEAALLEVMAGAVASGIARQKQERVRASLSQFFSNELTKALEKDDRLLEGRDAEVTVLFCDIRRFSSISERIGPKQTFEWMNDVMTELSRCVQQTHGVLVNYIGDELMAMWGAPGDQPNHASLACDTAVRMERCREPLCARWREIAPEGFDFGIGLCSGLTRVGNMGSEVKFAYGPLGSTVNLASRVQGITKQFGVSCVVTESTARACEQGIHFRRLAIVRPVGFIDPVTLFELKASPSPIWFELTERYESALKLFLNSDLTATARQLASLVDDFPNDKPSMLLLARTVNALAAGDKSIDPIWTLQSK